MIQVRATTIPHRSQSGEPWVAARLEVCWSDGQWLNLGLLHEHEDDWRLLLILMTLGARRTSSVKFSHVQS